MIAPPPPVAWHALPMRVYFEDTDAGGVTYYARYLAWAERGRIEALRDLGLPHQAMMDAHNSLLVVRRATVEYAAPARLDDLVVVQTRVLAVGGATVALDQRVLRDAATLVVMAIDLACIDRTTLRARRIPPEWRARLGADDMAEGTRAWTAA